MLFAPGPIWADKPAVVVAGGPSFDAAAARRIGIARARNAVRVVAINDSVYPCWFADICYASDIPWWQYHQNLPGFEGRRVGLRYADGAKMKQPEGVDLVEASGVDGHDDRPGFVRHGGNSGYVGVHLAAKLGAKTIILVGFDMKGDVHWFGSHPDGIRRSGASKLKWVERFGALAQHLAASGVGVFNASPDSALTCFPAVDLATVLGD